MTPIERLGAITKEIYDHIGIDGAEVYFFIKCGKSGARASITVRPCGYGSGNPYFCKSGLDHEDLKSEAIAWFDEHRKSVDVAQIRKMALAIIEAHLDLGECTDAFLRSKGFDQPSIIRLRGLACEQAQAMADSGPFSVKIAGGDNGAPAEGDPA